MKVCLNVPTTASFLYRIVKESDVVCSSQNHWICHLFPWNHGVWTRNPENRSPSETTVHLQPDVVQVHTKGFQSNINTKRLSFITLKILKPKSHVLVAKRMYKIPSYPCCRRRIRYPCHTFSLEQTFILPFQKREECVGVEGGGCVQNSAGRT